MWILDSQTTGFNSIYYWQADVTLDHRKPTAHLWTVVKAGYDIAPSKQTEYCVRQSTLLFHNLWPLRQHHAGSSQSRFCRTAQRCGKEGVSHHVDLSTLTKTSVMDETWWEEEERLRWTWSWNTLLSGPWSSLVLLPILQLPWLLLSLAVVCSELSSTIICLKNPLWLYDTASQSRIKVVWKKIFWQKYSLRNISYSLPIMEKPDYHPVRKHRMLDHLVSHILQIVTCSSTSFLLP